MKNSPYKIKLLIGDIVTLKTDIDKLERMVTGFTVRQMGTSYELAQGTNSSWHYEMEMEFEKNETVIGFKR